MRRTASASRVGDDADGLARFADICVRAFAGTAAVVKPQSAFFESYGSRGIAVPVMRVSRHASK